jgi:hypothetical protein
MDALDTIPSSPTALYRARRLEGEDHDAAVAACAHAFGRSRREIEDRVTRIRAELEAPKPPEPPVIEPEPVIEAERDRFELAEGELAGQIAVAENARQRLSLDALSDQSAQADLRRVEGELASLRSEAERVALAAIEDRKRQREQEESRRQQLQATAEAAAEEAGAAAIKSWAKFEKAANNLAAALREHENAVLSHNRALSAAGHEVGRWGCPPQQIQVLIGQALNEHEAPTSWCGF